MRTRLPRLGLLLTLVCGCGSDEAAGESSEPRGAPCATDDDCAEAESCAVGRVREVELEAGDELRCVSTAKVIGNQPSAWSFETGGRPLAERLCLAGGLNRGAGPESDAIRTRQIELITAARTALIRLDFPWAVIEPERGSFDFSQLDPAVDAAQAAGVEVIGIVAYGVPWASSLTESDQMYPPDDPADYANYARALSEHYTGRVRRWELWNEPNGGWRFFRPKLHGDAAHYARMMVMAADAIHSTCSDCVVYSAGLFFHNQVVNGAVEFSQDMLSAEPDAFESVDGFGIHPYPRYPPAAAPENDAPPERAFAGMLEDLDGVFDAFEQVAPPYAASELGWPSYGDVDEPLQASFLSRSILLGAALGADPLCWFTLSDGPKFGTFPPEDDFGLYRHGSADPAAVVAAKPSRDAFALLAELGQGALFSGGSAVGDFHDPSAGRFALDFDAPAGRFTALWQVSEPPTALHLPGETRRALDQQGVEIAAPASGALDVSVSSAPIFLVP